jgi:hypothetical protein
MRRIPISCLAGLQLRPGRRRPSGSLLPSGAALAGSLVILAGSALAAPPQDNGTRSGGGETGIGGFTPPPGAEFDPSTTADPGLLDRPRKQAQDQTYGPTGGYDIVDAGSWDVQTGWTSQAVPDYHIVQQGDTLSGICAYYYGDMYLWPKIWSYNPHITNAHWIFPGDRIRLTDPYESVSGPGDGSSGGGPGLSYAKTYDPRQTGGQTYLLERYAFIDEDELNKSMEIVGGANAAIMMGTLDTAYIGYDQNNPPIPGERLSVYRKKQPVYDIKVKGKNQKQKKGKRIGWLVEVVGEVYVRSVAEKSAEAEIVDSVQPVERGNRVGELKTRFTRVSPSANEVTTNGLVVEIIREHTISGETQFVIVNLGAEDGIRRGNTMEVVQKGDAYTPDHRLHQPYDKGHPRRVLARLMVLQIEGDSALTVVTDSLQEVVIGDHVEIIAAGDEPEDFDPYDANKRDERRGIEAEGSTRSEDGSVEAEGSLRVGG